MGEVLRHGIEATCEQRINRGIVVGGEAALARALGELFDELNVEAHHCGGSLLVLGDREPPHVAGQKCRSRHLG